MNKNIEKMGCNCKKNSGSKVSSIARASIAPKGRGVNNGKSISKVKRVMRRQFK